MHLDLEEQIAVLFLKGYEMRPKPFLPEVLNGDNLYIRDKTRGWSGIDAKIAFFMLIRTGHKLYIIVIISAILNSAELH